ncbi:MAG: hypothetical protein Q9211_005308, partial [Gyalolechia sp. 1 TL-2023]
MLVAVEVHVPAWKRLGLRLKNAPAETDPAPESLRHTPTTRKKRKSDFDDITAGVNYAYEKPAKKPKESRDQTESSTVDPDGPESADSLAATAAKPTLTRKSVSFTPETKTQDGDSTRDLYNSWIATQKASDSSFDPSNYGQTALKSTAPPQLRPATRNAPPSDTGTPSKDAGPPEPQKKKKKKKKRNKSKSTTLTSIPNPANKTPATTIATSPTTTHPALTYLTTHHNSPASWKFIKSRSSYLLRHCFSPVHIPTSYDPALKYYLQGLQGAGARRRLVDRALGIGKEDDEWLRKPSPLLDEQPQGEERSGEENAGGWNDINHGSLPVGDGGLGKATTMDDPSKRKELFLRAVAEHESLLRDREDAREEAEKDAVWRAKVERRRRAEMVLGIFEDLVGGVEGGPQGVRDSAAGNGDR